MYFTDGKLRGLEKFMSLPRHPTKKGGGKYRSSYHYTKNGIADISINTDKINVNDFLSFFITSSNFHIVVFLFISNNKLHTSL